MKLIIASNNEHKIREIKEILPEGLFEEVLSLKEAGVSLDVEESGSTFAENARLKAEAVRELTGCAALADDSGICVPALGGKPGIHSARYAGTHGDDRANLDKLLEDMDGLYDADRYAYYVCALAYAVPGHETFETEGTCGGVLIREPRGEGGFGYDPIFLLPYVRQTLAEVPAETKNHMSHRYHALCHLAEYLKQA